MVQTLIQSRTGTPWRVVLFDLDGTLRYNVPSPNDVMLAQAVSLGVSDSAAARKRALRWAHFYWADSHTLAQDLRRFPKRDADFWVHYTARQLVAFGCSRAQATQLAPKVQAFMSNEYLPEDRLYPELSELLGSLREVGYLLGVLSNRSRPFHDYIEEKGLRPYFDLVLAAGEVGAWKPSPFIFRVAIERMGVRPNEVVYVGDNYFADVLGAQRAGLFPLLVDPEQLFSEMNCQSVSVVTDVTPNFLTSMASYHKCNPSTS